MQKKDLNKVTDKQTEQLQDKITDKQIDKQKDKLIDILIDKWLINSVIYIMLGSNINNGIKNKKVCENVLTWYF